jgi:hypothetical protein
MPVLKLHFAPYYIHISACVKIRRPKRNFGTCYYLPVPMFNGDVEEFWVWSLCPSETERRDIVINTNSL